MRCILSWMLFGIGHSISVVADTLGWWACLYTPYNWFMARSSDIQQWPKPGPWEQIDGQ
jgi:hypothetical protein